MQQIILKLVYDSIEILENNIFLANTFGVVFIATQCEHQREKI